MTQKPDPLLAEIAELHQKLEAAIEKATDARARAAPLIPRGVIRDEVTRHRSCLCKAVKDLLEAK